VSAPVTTHAVLSQTRALVLGQLLVWIASGQKVRYSVDGGTTLLTGVLRHVVVGPTDFNFQRAGADVRDGYVRITSTFDSALPIEAIVDLMLDGLFVAES
jgi:hypothetical protein